MVSKKRDFNEKKALYMRLKNIKKALHSAENIANAVLSIPNLKHYLIKSMLLFTNSFKAAPFNMPF